MSTYAITRARHVLDRLFAAVASPLLDHADECEEVESYLEDEASCSAYRRELVFQLLLRVVGEKALPHSPLTPAAWQKACRQAEEAAAKDLFPELSAALADDHPQLDFARVTTFILNQYAYKDLVSPRPGDIMLDCGAYLGESALWARRYGADKVYSFEPSPSSFAHLQQNAQRHDPNQTWFFPVAAAVGHEEGVAHFTEEADHPAANRIDPQGAVEVPVVTLDAWCEEHKIIPQFIKMDLEGSEASAILGAERLFREVGPRFAICLYHRLEDMWLLPRALKTFRPDYKFWCKKSAPAAEFVLFGRTD